MSNEFDTTPYDGSDIPSSAVDGYYGVPTSQSSFVSDAENVMEEYENEFAAKYMAASDSQQYDDEYSTSENQISIGDAADDDDAKSYTVKNVDVEDSEPIPTATVLVDSTIPTDMSSSLPMPLESVDDARDDTFLLHSVYFLAAGMFCNFAMYAPVQNVITTVFPGSATVSLIFIYLFFTLGTIVAPTLVRYLSAQNGLIIGCLGYLAYTLGCLTETIFFFLLTSIVVGLCASIIWTSQGASLTALSNPTNRGRNSAIVIGCIRLAAVCSNLVMGYVLNATNEDGTPTFSTTALFLILFCIGSGGFIAFSLLRLRMRRANVILARRETRRQLAEEARLASEREGGNNAASSSPPLTIAAQPSLLQRLVEIFRVIGHRNYRHIFPILFIVQGMGNGFFFGTFGVTMGKNFLGFAQSAMGVMAVTCIINLGRELDRVKKEWTYRKKYVLYVTMSFHVLLYIMAAITSHYSDGFTSRSPEADYPRTISFTSFAVLVYSTCIFFGIAWSGSDITNYYLLGQCFADRSEAAFAAKSFAESIGFVVAQLLTYIIPPKIYPILAAIWTLPVIYYYSRWDMPIDLVASKSTNATNDESSSSSVVFDAEGEPTQPVVWKM